jgi:hypothetical protein
LGATESYGMTVVAADFDEDGWPDILVACDSTPTLLFMKGAKGHPCLQALRILTLEPERLKNRLATTRRRSPEMEGSSPETLKRLAILVFWRRSFPPSSTESA